MQARKKILSYFLLVTYLLVALHHNASFYQFSEPGQPPKTIFHQHEGYASVHHENHFHVGILHFLGHLFENTNHLNESGNEHLQVSQGSLSKKVIHFGKPTYFSSNWDSLVIVSSDVAPLPDPPYHLSFLQKLKLPNTPLRAPPAFS